MIVTGSPVPGRTWHGVPIDPPRPRPVEVPPQPDRASVGSGAFTRAAWKAAGIAGVVSAAATVGAMAAFLAAGPGPAQALLEPIARFGAYGAVAAAGTGLVSGLVQGFPSPTASKAWRAAQGLGIASAVGSVLTPATFGTAAFMPASLGTLALATLATGAAGLALASALASRS